MGVRDATAKDLVEELLLLRNEGCEDIARVTGIYNYLDKEMIASSEMRTAFVASAIILVKRDALSIWLSASECFWSEAETTQLNSSLKACYPDLKQFFLEALGISISAYDRLLDSAWTSLADAKRNMLSLMDETKGAVPEFPVEPVRKAKVFPVEHALEINQPSRLYELCSVDTEINMLYFDLIEVRRLQPFFQWVSIEDRYLSRCVKEELDTVVYLATRRWDLRAKAYHIARFGSCHDALSLYRRLCTAQIIQVFCIYTSLEIVQDDQVIQSDLPHAVPAHISDDDDGLIIYVDKNEQQQLCFFSVLPRKLQEWLMKDSHRGSDGASFEVVNALTSILASDVAALDGILEDQGIVQVPFENQAAIQRKNKIKVRLPTADEREPLTLVIRERSF
ncbi:hypothetical protein F66182_6048 [Fusarium sp. NRRL 66182]|nr:hypothetical protein F66182_6048 [Fusarium sp. NRRL 66182]